MLFISSVSFLHGSVYFSLPPFHNLLSVVSFLLGAPPLSPRNTERNVFLFLLSLFAIYLSVYPSYSFCLFSFSPSFLLSLFLYLYHYHTMTWQALLPVKVSGCK